MNEKEIQGSQAGNVVRADFGKEARDNPVLRGPRLVRESLQKAEFVSFCEEMSLSARDADRIWAKIHAMDAEFALADVYFAAAEAVARKTLEQEMPQKY